MAIKLTEEQAAVAAVDEGNHLVAAGAGAGKTATLIERVVALLTALWIAHRVLVLTFTRGAAREFSERVVAADVVAAHDVEVRTLHSWGYKVLREEGLADSVLTRGDQIKILRDGFRSLSLCEEQGEGPRDGFTPEIVLGSIASFKRVGMLPPDLRSGAGADTLKKVCGAYGRKTLQLYRYYETHGWEEGNVDFADMILRTAQLLSGNDALAKKYAKRYDHVMVDETQDNTAQQWMIVNALTPHVRSTLCVGDDWQSIYKFAGAVSRLFVEHSQRDDVVTHVLPHNFRSTRPIVEAGLKLIRHNTCQVDKDIKSIRDGDAPTHVPCANSVSQATTVRQAIEAQLASGIGHRDIHVLYRTRASSAMIERELLNAEIPYVIRGGRGFFTLSHVKAICAYMKAARGDYSDLNGYVVNVPKRFLGRAFISKARDCDWNFTKLDFRCKGRLARAWNRLREDLLRLQQAVDKAPSALMERVLQMTGADDYTLEETLGGAATDEQGNGGAVEEDIRLLRSLCAEHDSLDSWLEFVEKMAQETKAISPDEEPPDAVILQTIHRAKGTESKATHVVDCNEGNMPHALALSEPETDAEALEALEEERRIAFVAFSRAADDLRVYSTSLNAWGLRAEPSRFINEAGL